MIAGGSRIAAYLATRLLDMNIAVKIIEKNLDKALDHALRFPDVPVICGDGTDQATLLSENLDGMDGFVSLTDNDEENVIISMFAEQQGVEHVVPKVNRVELGFLLENRASPMP
ncbi:NAD-binding protein [Faecalibaculum rodentium]|uniref:NAD-binding protein n=1 Tax=Faecalibaculum rodentium TaxID=1702221 RepID=UPI0023F0466C|nr:NAD-binding protein [Faecalibaculum rodentium]